MCKRKAANPEEADFLVKKWVDKLLSKASKILETYVSNDLEANKDSSFLTPPTQSSMSHRTEAAMSELLSRAISAVYTIGSIVLICPSVKINAVVPMLHKIITSGRSGSDSDKKPRPAVSIEETAPALYFQAWLAMGKICLADEKLAKRYIPLFVEVCFTCCITYEP